MGQDFLNSVVAFLASFQTSLNQLRDQAGDNATNLTKLIESGEAFEFAENIETHFIKFFSIVSGYDRAKIEKNISIQLSDANWLSLQNVAETILISIRNVAQISFSLETMQKTNAVLVAYEAAFVITEVLTRYESKLNPSAFLDKLRLQTNRDQSLELIRIARYLQNHVQLVANGRPYRITEIEAYLHSAKHPDPYVHCAAEQEKHCHWYLHRRGRTFLEGKHKGLDITFGEAGSHKGGFLLRGISALTESGHYVDGPSKCVDELLETLGLATAKELGEKLSGTLTKEISPQLYLESVPHLQFGEWCAAPRVGLSLNTKKLETQVPYFESLYRFHICPDQTHIDRKLLFLALIRQGWRGGHARLLMNITELLCRRALDAFKTGKDKSAEDFSKKKTLSEQDRCELSGAFANEGTQTLIEGVDLTADASEHPHFSEFKRAG